nr:hypothetical protein [Tanacetum cinerariifolium]
TVAEDVAPAELQCRKKRKTKVVDAGEPFHPAKKLRGDYGAPGISSVGEAEVDFVVRTSVPIMTNVATATPIVDPAAIAKEKLVSASVFGGDSSSTGGSHPISGGFSDCTGGDFLSRRDEIENLKVQLIVNKAEAAEAVRLRDETQTLKERNIILEKEKSELEVKVTDLAASVKCLHSSEYLSALEAAIGKAIEKGMQYGLAAGITHGAEGRTLADVAAY